MNPPILLNGAMFLFFLFIGWLTHASTRHYTVVKTAEFKAYMLVKGVARAIKDNATIETFGFKWEALSFVDHEILGTFLVGDVLPTVKLENGSPDEAMRVVLLKIGILQPILFNNVEMYTKWNFFDQALVIWRGNFFGVSTPGWSASETPKVWSNLTLTCCFSTSFMKPADDAGLILSSFPFQTNVFGQDGRVLVANDTTVFIILTHVQYKYTHFVLPKYFIVQLNSSTHNLNISPAVVLINEVGSTIPEKNWSPFLYEGRLYMIHTINPMRVVRGSGKFEDSEHSRELVEVVSQVQFCETQWEYGHLRGGTNAIFLGDKYLAFFHSQFNAAGTSYKTYWMGCYTFSAKPPFKLLAISPAPIIHNSLYEGPWHQHSGNKYDYVVFPLGASLLGEDVVLSFSAQDEYSYISKLNLQDLLKSLIPLNCA